MKRLIILLFVLPLIISAQDPSSWSTIQSEILDPSCVDCHYEGSSFAKQSGLVLTSDVAFNNLVDAAPHNNYAEEDGLLRVSSVGGQPGLELSFLWLKINAAHQDHFYEEHFNYGSLMPLGLPYLTNGELKFIEEWITAGAPEYGNVSDLSILNDTSRFVLPEFKALTAPDNGFQLHVGPVDIWSAEKYDREFLYFEPYQTTEDLYMSGYEITMRPGSHHYLVYNYPNGSVIPQANEYRDMRTQNGLGNLLHLFQLNNLFPLKFFVGTQTPYINYSFPEGVALLIPAGSGFDHNLHSVNRSGETITGEVYTNIYTSDKSNVKYVAYNGNFSNYNLELPPNKVTTITKDFMFEEQTHIVQIWAHAHEKMTEFNIEAVGGERDGELIYWTNDWEHPPYLRLDPPMTFEAGEGVRLITTYDNWENRTIKFGPLSSDEMQFMFFIYFTGDLSIEDPSEVEAAVIPVEYSLSQNYPNPFNPITTLSYSIPKQSLVVLKIFDVLGNEIKTLVNENRSAGNYEIEFNAASLSSGIYFYRLQSGDQVSNAGQVFVETKKMILLK